MQVGRPKIPDAEKRIEKISVSFSAFEKIRIERAAKKCGLSLAVYLREAVVQDSTRNSKIHDDDFSDLKVSLSEVAGALNRLRLTIEDPDIELQNRDLILKVLKAIYTLLLGLPERLGRRNYDSQDL